MKTFTSPDGVIWRVDVQNPGSSNAMVVFRHPDGGSSRKDRYNWYLSRGPEARSVTSRLLPKKVLEALDDEALSQLFRRSMRVSRPDPLKARVGG
jgi:hypothetical protein